MLKKVTSLNENVTLSSGIQDVWNTFLLNPKKPQTSEEARIRYFPPSQDFSRFIFFIYISICVYSKAPMNSSSFYSLWKCFLWFWMNICAIHLCEFTITTILHYQWSRAIFIKVIGYSFFCVFLHWQIFLLRFPSLANLSTLLRRHTCEIRIHVNATHKSL